MLSMCYIYRFSIFCNSDSCPSFSILKRKRKGKEYVSPLRARMSDNYRKGYKGKKQRIIPKMKQRRFKTITLQGSIEKSPILLLQF